MIKQSRTILPIKILIPFTKTSIGDTYVTILVFRVTGTHICHVITVTRFMQPMPVLTLSSSKSMLGSNLFRPGHIYMNTNFLQRCGYMVHWPLPHKMLSSVKLCEHSSNLFRYMQNCTFCFTTQLQEVYIEGESYK